MEEEKCRRQDKSQKKKKMCWEFLSNNSISACPDMQLAAMMMITHNGKLKSHESSKPEK